MKVFQFPPHSRVLRPLCAAGLLVGGLAWTACNPTTTPPEPTPEPSVFVPPEDGTIGALEAFAHDPTTQSPFDATLSPDGSKVFYLALTLDDEGAQTAGVFTVDAAGGTPSTLAMGAPLQGPSGIDVTLDGTTLLVADPAAEDDNEDDEDDVLENGALFAVPVAGGAATIVAGTETYAPTGVVVAQVGEQEYAYFTGRNPTNFEPALFRVAPSGGVPEVMAEGGVFRSPGAVAVTKEGVAFVVDNMPEQPRARVIKVENGEATVILDDIGVGYPAGIALSKDESVFLVSGIDPVEGHDTVYRVVISSLAVTQISDPISEFAESAGLHRAHDVEAYAWADSEADGTGTVYKLTPPTE